MRSGVVEAQSPEDAYLELCLLSGPLTGSSKGIENICYPLHMINGFKDYQIYWNTVGSLQRYLDTYIIEKAIIFIFRMTEWPIFTLEIKKHKQQ